MATSIKVWTIADDAERIARCAPDHELTFLEPT